LYEGRASSIEEQFFNGMGDKANDLWCADFQGEFMLADRRYC
jgi:hypothetical protein